MTARRIGLVAVLVGALSAVLAAAGPDALLPFEDLARAAGAEATVSVAFVIDFGGSAGPVAGCVKVPSGTSGYQALAAFTAQEQELAPTYNAAGLLCSIDGQPASGCGQAVNGGYVYWSYWHGSSGTWQYSSTGAFAGVQDGDVEGWRFEDPGKANATDPPPGSAPDYAALCGSVTSPTSGAPAAAPGTAPGPAPSPAVAPSVPPGGASAPTGSAQGGSTAPAAPTTTTVVPATGPAARPSPSGAPSTAPRPPATKAQSLRASATTGGAGDDALPAALGAGLVLVLAALAAWRWRRRSAAEP